MSQTITARDLSKYITEYRRKIWLTCGINNLHTVIDDYNIEDDHIKWCLQLCIEDGDIKGEYIATHLLNMRKTARH